MQSRPAFSGRWDPIYLLHLREKASRLFQFPDFLQRWYWPFKCSINRGMI